MNFLQSSTFKVFSIGFFALLMLIPLQQVNDLISEREGLRREAITKIAERWGMAQTIGGPVLVIPTGRKVEVEAGSGWRNRTMISEDVLLPDALEIIGQLVVEERHYGIYSTPVYLSKLKFRAHFLNADLKALNREDLQAHLLRAELRLPLSDVRGLREVASVRVAGTDTRFVPASGLVSGMTAVAVSLSMANIADADFDVMIDITLAGSQSLQFLPLARHSEVRLSAPWSDPSFIGAFLPTEWRNEAGQFEAHWQVLDLNRGFGQHWEEGVAEMPNLSQAAYGVELYQPVGLYQQNTRAGKYGVLFIGLNFITFFLFEVLRRLRVHPVQYLLVGVALCTFYIVLLALSEQIGFPLAYLIATACVVFIVAGYGSVVLGGRRAGFILGTLLTLLYGLLYGLVVSEQYSLLMGSIGLLVAVILLMYLTRRVDWYTLSTHDVSSAKQS